VLTTPGLVDALSAVQISRRIYQRMLTYTINKIMKTLEIAVFLSERRPGLAGGRPHRHAQGL